MGTRMGTGTGPVAAAAERTRGRVSMQMNDCLLARSSQAVISFEIASNRKLDVMTGEPSPPPGPLENTGDKVPRPVVTLNELASK